MVCIESREGGELGRENVLSLIIHELVHLFHYETTRVRMPAWFEEGLAESYGGMGAFEWNNGRLKISGELEGERLGPLLKEGGLINMDRFLTVDLSGLLAGGKDSASDFYLQSWAFFDYMSRGAGAKTARRFKEWQKDCCCRELDRKGAGDRFFERCVSSRERLEKDFKEYLEKASKGR